MSTAVAAYLMNPAEDVILFGTDLADGMWVIPEHPQARARGSSEDAHLRGERFRRVTQLRRLPASGGAPEQSVFIGEWVDGYQQVHSYGVTHGWIVKRDSLPGDAS